MGLLKAIQNIAHKREMRESKDEILLGEVIRFMVKKYGPLVELSTTYGDHKQARFRLLNHSLLYSVSIKINRWTGTGAISEALIGSKAQITIIGEIKNYLADPDELLNMWKTDFQNIGKIPLLGGIKVNHQLNSVLAIKEKIIEIGDFVDKNWEERKKLEHLLDDEINAICEQLKSFKKV